MRQARFVERHEAEWVAFEAWLDARAAHPRTARADRKWTGLADEDVPARYRRLCQQLGLARRRGYSPAVVARLQALMQRGHNALYRAPLPRLSTVPKFLFAQFPRMVREERVAMLASLVLFALPLFGTYLAVLWWPDLAYSVFDDTTLRQMEWMHDKTGDLGRDSGNDLEAFGMYIWNNVGIGFRTFASGLLAGVGTAFVLVFNGLFMGTVFGHLQNAGLGGNLGRFAVTHGALELTAIVILGGAGMRMGLDLLAPGRRRRVDALIEAGRRGGLIALGASIMMVAAAFIEAFWSSIPNLPDVVRFGVAGLLWTAVGVWFWRGGRSLDRAP